jgi:HEAT repeat protein
VDITHRHGDPQDEAALDRARIQGLTVREALARVQPLAQRGDAGAEVRDRAGRAYVALTALLRQDPSALAQVRDLLLKKGPLTDTLLAALRDASTPESQKLLAQMASASSPLDGYDRMEAARALSLVTTPTSDTVQTLKDLRSDPELGTQATYGLGSALHRLQDEDPGLAAQTRDALTSQLSSATTDGQRGAVLTALGNAGDSTTFDLIRKYVSDPSPSVRAAAAQALRRIPGADADALLATLCADPIPTVRESALDAISERTPDTVLVGAVSPVALGDQVFRARAMAVNLLAQWLPRDSTIAPALQQVADRDPSEDLRNVARHALGRG